VAKGIILGIPLVIAAAKALTSAIDRTTKFGLEINSPSKVGVGIGENYGKSIGSGILHMLNFVKDSSETLAKTTVDVMTETLGNIGDLLDYDYDLEPRIVPVIDLSNVDAGLDQVFNKTRKLALSDVAIKSTDNLGIQEISPAVRQRTSRPSGDGTVNNTVNNNDESRVQIVNNYSVRNDNDIRKISRDQKNLLDRYNLARGVTT
jgi:hypothetical protein